MTRNRIVVVGSINMDLVTRTAKIPVPGETVIGGDLQTYPGGKGANQAVAAARQGAGVAMVAHVGQDAFARQLLRNLAQDGVDHTHVTPVATASGVALIIVDDAGQNSIVVASGANGRLTAGDVQKAQPLIQSADLLLLQLEVPLQAVQCAAQLAHDADVRVILNPAPARPLPAALWSLVDILVPNETEAAVLAGASAAGESGLLAAAQQLHALGVPTIILTLGARGALLAQDGQFTRYPAFSVDQVLDTTAAGDAFLGGLSAALAGGSSIAAAVPWGNAAGALAVTRAGAQPSLPTKEEVQKLLSLASEPQRKGQRL
jgi:ribokinase